MKFDFKTALVMLLPMIGVAVAWGASMQRIENLETKQQELVTVNQLETVKTQLKYVEQTTNENKKLLLEILTHLK
tara:strand:- start:3942 stop:4166 length:225 start_codon:yes stop_codon:yes gene_type:complete